MTEETAKKASEILMKKSNYIKSLSYIQNTEDHKVIPAFRPTMSMEHCTIFELAFPKEALKEYRELVKQEIKKAIKKIDNELELLNC